MTETRVVNLYKEKYDVHIGRGSIWGNPFIIGKHGNRKQVIEKYKNYILNDTYLMSQLYTLKGKVLGCFCKPKECHGDILVELVEKLDIENKL
jgi:predicted glycosyltransferase involved in capsule biosynthesis